MSSLHILNLWREDTETTNSFKNNSCKYVQVCINYVVLLYSDHGILKPFWISNISCRTVQFHPYNNCILCTSEIEDEYHFFLLKCPFYCNLKEKFLKKFYYIKPYVFKLIQLLSTQNVKDLCNLGKYFKNAFVIRKLHV